ncbi:MAG TPA: WecB/TagA/CpsF family glycosyltransferase [Verrucomicrobiae bacterium]|nr:WecB/TagA/CpsF family glycosyltransferase [Verrucomicrobiae bacterium]
MGDAFTNGPAVERVNVLGVGVSVLNLERALAVMADAIANRRKGYITVTGVHGVTEAQDDEEFRRVLNGSFLCTPDGMPMVWMGKLAGHKKMDRVYGPDLMELICEKGVALGWKHFFYGGAPGVADELKGKLEKRFPGMQVVGTFTPPFRALNAEEERVLGELVTRTKPDLFWVGLSTPKQERFMAAYLPKLETTLMIGVGAAFDFHAGKVKQAPRWIQRSGLEWAYRVWQEPRRLWKRYARNNPLFVARVILQKTGLRKYSLD